MDTLPYHDFRGFIEEAKKISEWRLIEDADWDGEIGALIESTAELDSRPMLLFDKIKGIPLDFDWSVSRLPITNARRSHSVSRLTKASSKSCVCSRAK